MACAIISDIHSNTEALDEVLKDIEGRGIEEIICLGDVIGYGPNPVECAEDIQARCKIVLCGNHDEALTQGAGAFNKYAREAIDWTREQLKPGLWGRTQARTRRAFLDQLPLRFERNGDLYVHASPRDPTSEYILESDLIMGDTRKFEEIFGAFERFLFVGHTHIPCVITDDLKYYTLSDLNLEYAFEGRKAIINVGSVGQPRDRDTRACYVTLDGDRVAWHRVDYDKEATCKKIIRIKQLDDKLGYRLLEGV